MAKQLFRFRFAEPDRERYGEQVYELDVSPNGLSRIPIGTLERFEDETGMRVLGDWLDRLGDSQLKAVRAFMWLAWTVTEPSTLVKFDEFQPDVIGAMNSPDFSYEYEPDAEGNGASPTTRSRAKGSRSTSRSSSTSRTGRRASAN